MKLIKKIMNLEPAQDLRTGIGKSSVDLRTSRDLHPAQCGVYPVWTSADEFEEMCRALRQDRGPAEA